MIYDRIAKHVLLDKSMLTVDTKKSHGSWFIDLNTGKEYLDMLSQFASQPLSWNHPKLVAHKEYLGEVAINKITNSDVLSEVYADFVDSVSSITPDFQHHFYVESSGALAVENALKAAFDWKCKVDGIKDPNILNVISMTNAFHGRAGYGLSILNSHDKNKTNLYPKFHWTKVDSPHIGSGYSEEESLKKIKSAMQHTHAAAFIAEIGGTGEGGNNFFTDSFLQEIRNLCNQYSTLFIADEVQTGLSTGKWWGYQYYHVIPDIICFAKKMQVGGLCCTSRIDSIKNNVFKIHSRINSTFGGDYVSMARFSIILKIIKEDNLIENSRIMGDYCLKEMQNIGLENPRGRGCMLAFDLSSKDERDKVLNKLNERMMVLPCGKLSIRLRPHLDVTRESIDEAIKIIKQAV